MFPWMRIHSEGGTDRFYIHQRDCFCSLRKCILQKHVKEIKAVRLEPQAKLQQGPKIIRIVNRSDQHTSSALDWSLIASVKHCTPPKTKKQTNKKKPL